MSNLMKFFSGSLILSLGLAVTVYSQEPSIQKIERSVPALSTIHSEQLRQIMRRLYELASEREFTELGLDQLRAEQIEALVMEADTLVINADNLPELLSEGQLTTEEQITFKAVANQLYTEALSLQADVYANKFLNIEAGYRRMQQTCNACHNLFRNDR